MKSNTATDKSEAWTRYWSAAPKVFSGCLPEAPAAVTDLIEGIWTEFFDGIPQKAKVLDLGTGGGAVLMLAHANRPDLKLTGVDYANSLPDLDKDISLFPQINLEELPFEDKTFEAVTSQFAIEYASEAEAVSELKRVLTQGGVYLLLCHNADSIIVKHNVTRLETIKDLLSRDGLIKSAIKIIKQKKMHAPKSRKHLSRLLQAVQIKHPDEPIINEVAGNIASITTEMGSLKKIMSLCQNIKMEGQRISALKKSALTQSHAEDLGHQLRLLGRPAQLHEVYLPETRTPLAWKITNMSI
jgi:ubiquinone/menaquinone biosynthesis C-methylase UbiE